MNDALTLDQAVDLTRTGDLWLFRGSYGGRSRDPDADQLPGQPCRDGRRDRRPAAADVARRAVQGAHRRLDRRQPSRRPAPRPPRGGRPVVGHLPPAGLAPAAHARGRASPGGRAAHRDRAPRRGLVPEHRQARWPAGSGPAMPTSRSAKRGAKVRPEAGLLCRGGRHDPAGHGRPRARPAGAVVRPRHVLERGLPAAARRLGLRPRGQGRPARPRAASPSARDRWR